MRKMFVDFVSPLNWEGNWIYPSRKKPSEVEVYVFTKQELEETIIKAFIAGRDLEQKTTEDLTKPVISYMVPKYFSAKEYLKEIL